MLCMYLGSSILRSVLYNDGTGEFPLCHEPCMRRRSKQLSVPIAVNFLSQVSIYSVISP